MTMWAAIVLIVAIVIIGETVTKVAKMKNKESGSGKNLDPKIEDLEKRIESLESIVIDLERDRKYRELK